MFTPDGTELRLRKISPAAGQMYLYHCRWRDHKTGYSRKTFEQARADLGFTRSTAYRAHKELLDADWICEEADGRIGLRGGSFAPVDKTRAAASVWSRAPRPKNRTAHGNPKNETNRPKNRTAHNKERARGSSSKSSIQQEDTPPTPSQKRDLNPGRGDGVCVSPRRASTCADEELWAYADAHGLGGGWVTVARRTGEHDFDVKRYMRSLTPAMPPGAQGAGAPTADDGEGVPRNLPEHELEGVAEGLRAGAALQGLDLATEIAALDVSESDRERLRQLVNARDGPHLREQEACAGGP